MPNTCRFVCPLKTHNPGICRLNPRSHCSDDAGLKEKWVSEEEQEQETDLISCTGSLIWLMHSNSSLQHVSAHVAHKGLAHLQATVHSCRVREGVREREKVPRASHIHKQKTSLHYQQLASAAAVCQSAKSQTPHLEKQNGKRPLEAKLESALSLGDAVVMVLQRRLRFQWPRFWAGKTGDTASRHSDAAQLIPSLVN